MTGLSNQKAGSQVLAHIQPVRGTWIPPDSVLVVVRKRTFGERLEVVEADVPEGPQEHGRVGVGVICSCWELDSHFFGVRDQPGYRRLSQAAQGPTQNLGVQGPLGYGLSLDVAPGRGVCGLVAGEDLLKGARCRVPSGEWLAEVPDLAERRDQRCVPVFLVEHRARLD